MEQASEDQSDAAIYHTPRPLIAIFFRRDQRGKWYRRTVRRGFLGTALRNSRSAIANDVTASLNARHV
jgi:hypothetical protein